MAATIRLFPPTPDSVAPGVDPVGGAAQAARAASSATRATRSRSGRTNASRAGDHGMFALGQPYEDTVGRRSWGDNRRYVNRHFGVVKGGFVMIGSPLTGCGSSVNGSNR